MPPKNKDESTASFTRLCVVKGNALVTASDINASILGVGLARSDHWGFSEKTDFAETNAVKWAFEHVSIAILTFQVVASPWGWKI